MKKLFTLLYFQLCVDIIGLPLYYIFVGMLDNSINDYPNWQHFMIATVVNLLVAIKVGLLPISDDEK